MIKHIKKNRGKKPKTILVVDDEPLVCMFLSESLQKVGYVVVSARDCKSAWSEYKKTKPDLVLTDLKMPGESGFELLSWIRREDSATPVIIMTGYYSAINVFETMKLGADEFLAKPFRLEELTHIIEVLISKNPLELETQRLKNLVILLTEENKRLEEKIQNLSEEQNSITASKVADKYRAIGGATAHSLKGEFLHIGNSIKDIRDMAVNTPDIQEECDMIERSVEYSQILLRRLLDYIDMGKPRLEPINVLDLLRRTEQLTMPRLPSNIQLEITIDHSMKKRSVSANFEQLMGVLLELIQNAVNVLHEKGGTIEIKLEERENDIAISVKNNGPQIPRELRENLFRKQVASKSGLGLGLFFSNKVISELGGKLDLRTSRKQGTTFTILLPAASNKKES